MTRFLSALIALCVVVHSVCLWEEGNSGTSYVTILVDLPPLILILYLSSFISFYFLVFFSGERKREREKEPHLFYFEVPSFWGASKNIMKSRGLRGA